MPTNVNICIDDVEYEVILEVTPEKACLGDLKKVIKGIDPSTNYLYYIKVNNK